MHAFRPLNASRKKFLTWKVEGKPPDVEKNRPRPIGEPTEAIEQAQHHADDDIDPMGPAAIDRAQRDAEDELPKGPTGKILKREIQVPTAVGAQAR